MREVGPDVASNERDIRRLVILLLDDSYSGSEHGESTSARKIANRIVDALGPADLAAVAFTFDGRAQNLTADRTRLHAAIESYMPKYTPRSGVPLGCVLKLGGFVVSSLAQIGTMLRAAPQGRKIVMLISTNGAIDVRTDPFAQMTPVQEMYRQLQRANITVYAFNPGGLDAPQSIGSKDLWDSPNVTPPAEGDPTAEEKARQGREDLMAITGATGRTVSGIHEHARGERARHLLKRTASTIWSASDPPIAPPTPASGESRFGSIGRTRLFARGRDISGRPRPRQSARAER
jgi:hypothetical protein